MFRIKCYILQRTTLYMIYLCSEKINKIQFELQKEGAYVVSKRNKFNLRESF